MKRTNKHHGYHNKYNYTKDSKCKHCGVDLIADTEDPNYNWHDSRVARHHYICYPCLLFRYKENCRLIVFLDLFFLIRNSFVNN